MSTARGPYIEFPEHHEWFCQYKSGGYHPVHIGDRFKGGRYIVVNKLGYGDTSTVWLVRDMDNGTCASLKILTADSSQLTSHTELEVLRRVADGPAGEGKDVLLQLLDSFFHDGPNGAHLCIVTEVVGPNLSLPLYYQNAGDEDYIPDGYVPPKLSRPMALKLAQGVRYLHSLGIVHGDIRLDNLLYHVPALSSLTSQRDVENYFGRPQIAFVPLWDLGAEPPYPFPHAPRYAVLLPDWESILDDVFNPSDPSHTASLKICDFGNAAIHGPAWSADQVSSRNPISPSKRQLVEQYTQQRRISCPGVGPAPEVILENLVSPASDMWATGNTMYQLLAGASFNASSALPSGDTPGLLPVSLSDDKALCAMVWQLGKLPERWWNGWGARDRYYDEGGVWVGPKEKIPVSIYASNQRTQCGVVGPSVQKKFTRRFERIWNQIFKYEPDERMTADELVKELSSFLK